MLKTLTDLLTSKKFIASLAGTIVAFAGKYGIELDNESVALILSPLVAYILGQGIADTGKEAAKLTNQLRNP